MDHAEEYEFSCRCVALLCGLIIYSAFTAAKIDATTSTKQETDKQ